LVFNFQILVHNKIKEINKILFKNNNLINNLIPKMNKILDHNK